MNPQVYYEYNRAHGADFFTMVLKPDKVGKFPVVVTRSPYVGNAEGKSEEELCRDFLRENLSWAENNFVLVFQHCRGQGKSSGAFVPYIHEREDGLALREWIRRQDFYNGQLFLLGGSYTASLHYSTAPFENDIKGAVFRVQDSERYRLWYRNGAMRRGHANWHFNLYKAKSGLKKTHSMDSFSQLPLCNLSQRVLGERTEDFEQMLLAPEREHPFWETRYGGNEARDAVTHAGIPILFTTGYNDFYLGGMFRMWEEMDEETKQQSALLVSPYHHGDTYDKERGIGFPNGSVTEQFGKDFIVRWLSHIVNGEKPFVETGKITYYRTFENQWRTDFYSGKTEEWVLPMNGPEKSFFYDPQNPPSFPPEGCFMDEPEQREDVITIYTEPFAQDIFVKGRMKARLSVASDCEDTSFYMMIGIQNDKGDYALRHDITSILYQKEEYSPSQKVVLDFTFDEYAFEIKKGQRLRIDIAATDKNTYVCHSNNKGMYSKVEECRIAENKVFTAESYLVLPVEKE